MKPVDQLVALFGGIRPFQDKLGEKHHTVVQGWQTTGNIPHYREHQVREAASKHGVKIPAKLWSAVFPVRKNEAA